MHSYGQLHNTDFFRFCSKTKQIKKNITNVLLQYIGHLSNRNYFLEKGTPYKPKHFDWYALFISIVNVICAKQNWHFIVIISV